MIPGVPRAGHQPGVGAHTALKVIETKLESGALRISQAVCVCGQVQLMWVLTVC